MTLLVSIVAVFLSYNANSGLPFVPTYDLKAELPNAANLVRGNEVRIGGARVGVIDKIDAGASARRRAERDRWTLKLDKRARAAAGRLHVHRAPALGARASSTWSSTPGRAKAGFAAGATIPLTQATPEPVEIDEVFNTFDAPTPAAARSESLNGFGTGLAGRGRDLNEAIAEFNPLLRDLRAGGDATWPSPRTRSTALLPGAGRPRRPRWRRWPRSRPSCS